MFVSEPSPDTGGGELGTESKLDRMAQRQEEELQALEQEHQQKLDVIEKYHKVRPFYIVQCSGCVRYFPHMVIVYSHVQECKLYYDRQIPLF